MSVVEKVVESLINLFFAIWPQPVPSIQSQDRCRLIAHRGVHENGLARENSHESFDLALSHKIWGIEFDVQFTRDLVPVISHDADCGRLFARQDLHIPQMSWDQLRREVQIPTLQEIIEKYGQKIHLMIEIKDDLRLSHEKRQILIEHLKPLKPVTDYHLLTLNPDYLSAWPEVGGRTIMDVIWLNARETLKKNFDLEHGAISGHYLFFSDQQLAMLQGKAKRVGTGFIASKNSLFRELNRGVDYIFTNHPIRLQKVLLDSRKKSLDPNMQRR